MAFKNDIDRQLAKELIHKDKLVKEILGELGHRCTAADIYNLRYVLKKKDGGEAAPPPSQRKARQNPKSAGLLNEDMMNSLLDLRDELTKRVRAIDEFFEAFDKDVPLPK